MGIADEIPPEDNLDVDMVDDELNQDVPPQMGPPPMGPDGQPMVPPQMGAPQMGVPAAPDPLMGRQPMRQFMQDLMKKYQKKYMDDEQPVQGPPPPRKPRPLHPLGAPPVYPGSAADIAGKTRDARVAAERAEERKTTGSWK